MIAQDVPGEVARLQDDLRTERYSRYLEAMVAALRKDMLRDGRTEQELGMVANTGGELSATLANVLNISTLFHVTEPMASVARHLSEKVEDGLEWSPLDFPAREGILFYERPLLLRDLWGRAISIAAMQWYPAVNPSGRLGVSTVLYTDRQDIRDYYNWSLDIEVYRDQPGGSSGLGRYQVFEAMWMEWGQPVLTWAEDNPEIAGRQEPNHSQEVEDSWREASGGLPDGTPAAINLGLIHHTIFWLMTQTVANVAVLENRKLARRYLHKRNKPPPRVTVISLRRPEEFGRYETDGEHEGRWLTYRSLTRAHTRRQHYKDKETGEDRVKRILIHPYWRGPENAPVHQPKRVNTLKR